MALSGSFYKYPTGSFGLYCEWEATQSRSGNYSNVTMDVYLSYYTLSVSARTSATVSINGVSETYSTPSISRSSASSWTKKLLKTYTVKVDHNANGTKTGVKLSASYPFNGTYSGVSISTITASTTIDLDPITVYSLSVSAGTGSSITVNRTSSGYGSTGNLSNGATLYYNDKLKISFTPSTNYAIDTHTVNGSSFTSGNTHTVSGNVAVVSTATPQKSLIAATDANIGSTSTITVTRYNSSYTHTITYAFGDTTGTVCTKSSNVSIAWTVPTSFYAEIPNATSGKCTLTITTYNGSTSLGSNTCTMTATASSDDCAPSVSGTVVDTNSTTVALTGDSSVLILYKSTAECTLKATPKNSATISSTTIRGSTPTTSTTLNGVVTATKSYSGASYTSYAFAATDSRGYKTSVTVSPTVIKYVKLTCNPVITRPTPTGSSIVMSISGAFYRGSFGAASNTLTLKYRYRSADTSTYCSWQTISASSVTTGTSSYSVASFSLGEDFDYKTSYVFQVRATDGTADYTLTTVTKQITVQRGVPVFDWGANDFNVNVALMLENVNILDIMYPVGAVYMHSSSTLPSAVSGVGTWESVTTGISGVYAWKRTA